MGWRLVAITWMGLSLLSAFWFDDLRSAQYFVIISLIALSTAEIKSAIARATPPAEQGETE